MTSCISTISAVVLAIGLAIPPAAAQVSGDSDPPTAQAPRAAEGARDMRERRREMRQRHRAMREHREAREQMRHHRGPQEGWRHHHRGMRPAAMRMLFILIDTDGSGTLSVEEVTSVTERLFAASDGNGDGELTIEEIRAFAHGLHGGWAVEAGDDDGGVDEADDE